MISTPDVAQNMASAAHLIGQAAAQGATLVVLPEYWALMGMKEEDKIAHGESVGGGTIQNFMAGMAQQHQLWLIGGTLPMAAPDGKVFNTTLVYNPQGELAARYDKIHLFGFSKGSESYDEARTIVPGCEVAAVELPFGRVGLSVCYDLRFPELFRALGTCALLVLPAAFTHTTGQAHWEVLLRARAIENQCYLLASAQGGQHVNGRRTFGHSMIIDPWGKVLAVLPEGEGVVVAEIDLDYMQEVRTNLPALKHRKL
jgi:nitrilase